MRKEGKPLSAFIIQREVNVSPFFLQLTLNVTHDVRNVLNKVLIGFKICIAKYTMKYYIPK